MAYQGEGMVESARDMGSKFRKILHTVRIHFMKWAIFNIAASLFLMIFYIPYQIYWIQLVGIQFWRWFFTAAIFGSLVNILQRPYIAWITRIIERRYGKKEAASK